MSLKEMKEMISLMNDNGLSEIEMEREGLKVKLKKESAISIQQVPAQAPMVSPQAVQQSEPAKEASEAKPEPKNENVVEICSPMVGTFYQAPSPDSPPYVNIGDTIKVGQVLCIVEAMKLMNEIKSEVGGKLIDIKIKNAEPVEFNQVMFLIEKN